MTNSTQTPQDGFAGLRENFGKDLNAGILVSFLAMPLCLGIASASRFPPITGIFTAIIGGMVVAFFAGSRLTIKGPAAGLIAIGIGAVDYLGYEKALATIVVASLIQMLLGLLKAGKLGNFFPIAVIHGMLAAIGLIIFSKQIHILFGVVPTAQEPIGLLIEIPFTLMFAHWESAIIGILGLILIFTIPAIKNPFVKKLPAPMWVLLMAVPVAWALGMEDHVFDEKSVYLVDIPTTVLEGILTADLAKIGITFPDFSEITSPKSLLYIVMFSFIGSIESLLTVKAADGLDPFHRKSDMNKDLIAVGIGNFLAGMIGGFPMISEVARSSANIANGARTRWANFFHGLALLVFILFLANFIIMIPKSALAAMLLAVAYRLASPQEFIHTYQIGKEQLLVFVTTLCVTLYTDLLLGVGAGILVEILIQIVWGAPLKGLFKAKIELLEEEEQNSIRLKVYNSASFTNYLGFKKYLDNVPQGKHVIVDLNNVKLIDHTFMENLHLFELEYHRKGGSMEIQGLENQRPKSNHPLAVRVFEKNYGKKIRNVVLDARQKELEIFAKENDMGFRPLPIADSYKYANFRYFYGKKIRYRTNRLVKTIDTTRFEFADMLLWQTGDHLGGRQYGITILTMTNIIEDIPLFVLQKGSVFDKLTQALGAGSQDINFEDYPLFSKSYYLTSLEPTQTRQFFTPAIMTFFEQYIGSDFMIRSRDNRLMILKRDSVLPLNEMKEMFDLAKGLVELIKREHKLHL